MNEKTLRWTQEQLKQLLQPAMAGRQYNEEKEERHEPSTEEKTNTDAKSEAAEA